MDPHNDIPSSVDEYTSSVVAQFNHQYPCLADPIEQFEEECICSISIPFNEDDNFDVGNEFVEDASMPTKEQRTILRTHLSTPLAIYTNRIGYRVPPAKHSRENVLSLFQRPFWNLSMPLSCSSCKSG
jgi:hypothetical protein